MEYAFVELLTREEMLRILRERQLKIPNLEEQDTNELRRIYKMFAMPLARRENTPHSRRVPVKRSELQLEKGIPMELDMPVELNKNTEVCNNLRCVEKEFRALKTCEKRKNDFQPSASPLTDEYLSMAAKRIKIDWT